MEPKTGLRQMEEAEERVYKKKQGTQVCFLGLQTQHKTQTDCSHINLCILGELDGSVATAKKVQ